MFNVGDTVKVIEVNAIGFDKVGKVRAVEPNGQVDVYFPHLENIGAIHYDPKMLAKVEAK